jgi:hypothetical protein
MSDNTPENIDQSHPAALPEDEEIIDLLEEIAEESRLRSIASPDRRLSAGERPSISQPKSSLELPDISDLIDQETEGPGTGKARGGSDPEGKKVLEWMDATEEGGDDGIVWLDDLNPDKADREMGTEAGTRGLIREAAEELGQETGVTDLFSANVQAAGPDAATANTITTAVHPVMPQALGSFPPGEAGRFLAEDPVFPDAAVEAALERVIERKLGRTIESVIHQAIENAVAKEIERLKRLLLEDDPGAVT